MHAILRGLSGGSLLGRHGMEAASTTTCTPLLCLLPVAASTTSHPAHNHDKPCNCATLQDAYAAASVLSVAAAVLAAAGTVEMMHGVPAVA